eukprot:CAMPEP_0183529936 /NCGR_PEP_ID=MMETSP0371-20130417/23764_1 /TAXON_ID=268820 /ORGANISM="Peridinium aciculiferum, Strain PAER-2" /LENGTH=41 /DNA_ID= /DNA_START= /DNA_END= /DNA_ORIENTATION=
MAAAQAARCCLSNSSATPHVMELYSKPGGAAQGTDREAHYG